MNPRIALILILMLLGGGGTALAIPTLELQAVFAREARAVDPGFGGFSAERGANFYRSRHGGDWSCASCHSEDPAAAGSHAVTKKAIQPLAPAANAERFTNPAKTEKWFKRNCNDVLRRACTAQEKGDFIAYLSSVGPQGARR